MKYLLIVLLPFILVVNGQAASKEPAKSKTSFGSELSQTQPLGLSEVVANYDKYKGKKVVITGKVEKVCKKKGCWMSIESGTTQVRTLFKDYGFFVPPEILGKKIKAEGMLVEKELKPAEIRHFMKDAGEPASEVSKITKAKKVFQFIADGVQIVGS